MSIAQVQISSEVTCPSCANKSVHQMPTDACQWFWECPSCADVIRPKAGDCCVYCSYGTVPCPPIQAGDSCCG